MIGGRAARQRRESVKGNSTFPVPGGGRGA